MRSRYRSSVRKFILYSEILEEQTQFRQLLALDLKHCEKVTFFTSEDEGGYSGRRGLAADVAEQVG